MIKTLIAEQVSLIRAGLVALVSGTDDIEVVAEVQCGAQALCASHALCPDVAVLSADLPETDGYDAARNPLTSRELDALRLAAAGATTAEIATDLYLAVGTVRNYLSRVIMKTGARNRVDAIRIAADAGWL